MTKWINVVSVICVMLTLVPATMRAAPFNDVTKFRKADDVAKTINRPCVAAAQNWTVGANSCTASSSNLLNGATETLTDSTAPITGTATATCNNGTVTMSGASCGVAGCGGTEIGGYCWYLAGSYQSCDTACASRGGCDLAGIRNYTGTSGSWANCQAVAHALVSSAPSWVLLPAPSNASGCYYSFSTPTPGIGRETGLATTCAATPYVTAYPSHRVCSCNN